MKVGDLVRYKLAGDSSAVGVIIDWNDGNPWPTPGFPKISSGPIVCWSDGVINIGLACNQLEVVSESR